MARFAFAFANTTILTPARLSVVQAGMIVLENGSVLIQSLSQPWTLTAERLESGEIAVSGGNGLSLFRYSIDDGTSWLEDVSPSTIFHQGEVLFESIGTTESAGGINGASIGVEPDGDLVIYKLPSVWELTATRTVGHDIEISGGRSGSKFRYSLDAGASWFESFLPAIVTSEGAAIFEPLGDEIRFGGIETDNPLDADYVVGTFDAAHSILQTGPATALNKFGFVASPGVRTNLSYPSQEFDAAGWAKSGGSTVSANTAIAPNGTLTADTWFRATTSSNFMSRSVVKPATPQTLTFSVFVKKSSARYFSMRVQGLYPARSDVTFDLDTGLVSNGPTVNTFTNVSASITPLADGWYRCTLTSTTDSATTCGFLVSFATSNVPVDGVSASAVADGYLWGAQLELGSKATDYIPTTTTEGATSTLARFEYDMGEPIVGVSRTNKCTNFNTNPTDLTNVTKTGDTAATLSVVDDTAALTAAGLIGICTTGKVYKLDNSAGVVTAFADVGGQTGNVNSHTISAYARRSVVGSGNSTLQTNFGEGAVNITSASYVRVSRTFTPGGTNRRLGINAAPGAVVYFILNQLEEGSAATDIIPVYGAAVTTNLTYSPKVRGLLVEPTRINLLTYSEEFSNVAWAKASVTVTPNTFPAPNGTITADTLTFTGTHSTAELRQSTSLQVGRSYTFSIWAKVNSGTREFRLKLWDGVSDKYSNTFVADIEWRRFTFTVTAQGDSVSANAAIRNRPSGVTGDLIIWGAQLEAATEASSYIPTTTSAVTRPADVLTLNYTDKPDGVYTARLWHSDYDYTEVDNLTVLGGQVNITGVTTKPVLAIKLIFKSYLLRTQIPNVLPSQYNVIQPSVATRVSAAGVVGSPGARTNLIARSEEFDNGVWSQSAGMVTTPNTTLAPNGTVTADTLTFPAGQNSEKVRGCTVAVSTIYTFSVWARSVAGTKTFRLKLWDGVALGVSPALTATTAWQRFVFTTTTGSVSGGSPNVGILNYSTEGAGDLIVWGAQFEEAAEASNYIPTTTAAVTNTLPRFDYDAGILRGLLVEPARTNLVRASETFTTGWSVNDFSLVTGNVAPDGTLGGLLATFGASNYAVCPATVVPSTPYTASVFVKWVAGTPRINVGCGKTDSTNGGLATFDVTSSGVSLFSSGARGPGTFVGYTITPIANGWFRLTCTGYGTDVSGGIAITAAAVGTQLLLWGAQVEQGSEASNYIPTTTAAVTRPADTLRLMSLTKPDGTYTARCWHADNSYTDVLNVVVSSGATSITGISTKPVISVEFR